MSPHFGPRSVVFACLVVASLAGCSPESSHVAAATGGSSGPLAMGRPARLTGRPGDTDGGIPVLMYHKFASRETRYDRAFGQFRHDLQRLYDMGFRPITMSEYLSDHIDVPPGASPVVITFDDSNPTQFKLRPDGTPDPDCAYGIWQEFARLHPDFPVKATWYVLPTVMWGQRSLRGKKVEMLRDDGSELACHTWDHPVLRRLSDRQVKTEIAKSLDFLRGYGFDHPSFAYPYGIYPRHMGILDGFRQNDRDYTLTGAVTCDTDIAPAPTSDDFRPFKIPRIEAVGHQLDAWLDRIEKKKIDVFVAP